MPRSLLLLTSLLVATAPACGRRSLPQRSSPVLTAADAAPLLDGIVVRDGRRDGLFARSLDDAGVAVMRESGGRASELLRVPQASGTLDGFSSRSDALIALRVAAEGGDRLLRFDGKKIVDLTDRLRARLVIAHPTKLLRIDALDLDADGSIAVAVTVGGQGGDAPYGQLCLVGGAADRCESLATLTGDELGNGSDLVLESGRLFLVAEEGLYLRALVGPWSRLTTGVWNVRALSDGRLAVIAYTSGRTDAALHILAADGRQERTIGGASFAVGHAGRGLWQIKTESEHDGSCNPFSLSTCRQKLVWSQLIVQHIDLAGAVREVGHLDDPTGSGIDAELLPLADGGLRIESNRGVFLVAPPR